LKRAGGTAPQNGRSCHSLGWSNERVRFGARLSAGALNRSSRFDLCGRSQSAIKPEARARIAVGPKAGQKLFTLQTVPAGDEAGDQQGEHRGVASAGGFSLHAGIGIAPGRRQKLERLCRYVSRPPVATERMAMISSGYLRYALKTPYRDG
jgi:hypothetical protein